MWWRNLKGNRCRWEGNNKVNLGQIDMKPPPPPPSSSSHFPVPSEFQKFAQSPLSSYEEKLERKGEYSYVDIILLHCQAVRSYRRIRTAENQVRIQASSYGIGFGQSGLGPVPVAARSKA